MDLEAGQLVDDRYEVLRLAGSGEWHQLYEVADRSSGERFGLKIIDQAAARNAKRREDFLRQVQVARKLEHRNLLAVVGQGEHQGAPYLLTEHAPGESLAALLARQGRLSAQELMPIAAALCSALSFLHEQGIIHRDLRPGALALGADGRWKLRDFEMARDVGAQQTIALPGGAPPYRSPEQLLGRTLDARSDIYSAGAVLFEALTGQKPLEDVDVISRFMQPPPKVCELAEECPQELAAAVERCLEAEAGQRFGSIRELAEALGAVPGWGPQAQTAPVEPEPKPEPETLPDAAPEPELPLEPAPTPEPEPAVKPDAEPESPPKLEPVAIEPPPPPPEPKKKRRRLAELMGSEPGRTTQVVATLQQVLLRLQAMREEGLYHAPLSPQTIFVSDRDNEIEIDAIPPPEPGQTVAVRQPKYHAPEWLLEAPQKGPEIERADLYALGFIAYEWLAGRDGFQKAFQHDDSAQPMMEWMRWQSDASAVAPPLGENRSWVPRALSELVGKMIAKNPAEATGTYREAVEALAKVLAQVEDTRHVRPSAPTPPEGDVDEGLPWGKIAAAVVTIVAAAVAAWLFLG